MPQPTATPLPEHVRFRGWDVYQDKRATHWARLETSFLYDARIGQTDTARGLFATGLVLAIMGQGAVNIRAWIGQCSDKKRARLKIKSWCDNGLLIAIPAQIDRERDTTTTTSAADASGEPETAAPEPKGRARPAVPPVVPQPKPKPKAAAVVPLRRPSWLEPYAVAWERANGAGTFGAVAGQCARYLKPLDDAHGAESVAANLARYLAATEAQYHSLAHFAGTFARWGAAGGDPLASVRSVMARYGGPQHTPTEAWQEFDPPTRTAISAAGGLAAIWNQAPHTNGRRA